jgi:hypothetical protein
MDKIREKKTQRVREGKNEKKYIRAEKINEGKIKGKRKKSIIYGNFVLLSMLKLLNQGRP